MPQVLQSIEQLSALRGPVVLAIGVFDGVHLGHQAVIARAIADARKVDGTPVVVTFDPHPIRVLRPEQAPRLLTATPHKKRLLRQLGVEHLLVLPFDANLAALPPEDFIRALAAACRPLCEICVGHQWSFGRGRAGNLDLLKTLGDELGFKEVGIQAIEIEGQIVSSTSVRSAVEGGGLQAAARLLGRNYSILGVVVRGDGLGRTIGFPTANLNAYNEQLPPNGVYAVEVLDGQNSIPAVMNLGVRPTIAHATGTQVIEVHLLDFQGDLYGKELEVAFHQRLRPEMKFADLDHLKAQIALDVTQARAIL